MRSFRYALPWPLKGTATPFMLLICYHLLLTYVKKKVGPVTEEDVRRAERLAEVSLLRREVVHPPPHQKVLMESVYSKEEKQSPTEVYREFNNIMRLSGREQVSHKTLSVLVAELELYGFVEVEREGRGRGRGVDFTYIRLT